MIYIYNILLHAGFILGLPAVLFIVLISRKWRSSFLHRLGFYPHTHFKSRFALDPNSPQPIWIHALSVGEVLSAVPLTLKLAESGTTPIFFSATTKTGYDIARAKLDCHVMAVIFFPYDLWFSVKRIADRVNPRLMIIVETDIWPNFLCEMKKRGTSVILANARMSDRSYARYRRVSFLTNRIYGGFAKICVQTAEDEIRFRKLGIPAGRLTITGNVKFDQSADRLTDTVLKRFRREMHLRDDQKVIVAGSTHAGEETILLGAFNRLRQRHPNLLLILVPRHPDRASAIRTEIDEAGLSSIMMKDLPGWNPDRNIDVVVVDAIGLLQKLYALADIAFVGGSLVKAGGHNPLEPALYGKPVLFGPDMSDFKQIAQMLMKSGGGRRIYDAESLYHSLDLLLTDEKEAKASGENAYHLFNSNRGAIDRTLAEVNAIFNSTAVPNPLKRGKCAELH